MELSIELDKRISVLENSMSWAQGSIEKIDRNLDLLKNGQIRLLEKIADHGRISGMDGRVVSLQSHTDAGLWGYRTA